MIMFVKLASFGTVTALSSDEHGDFLHVPVPGQDWGR